MSAQFCGCDLEAFPAPHICERHTRAIDTKTIGDTPSMWGLSDALELIRELQPVVKPLGYHICLAGGVLNKGFSKKDLDLVFLPLTNEFVPDLEPLTDLLVNKFGEPRDNLTDPEPCVSLRWQVSFKVEEKRIDVFVV